MAGEEDKLMGKAEELKGKAREFKPGVYGYLGSCVTGLSIAAYRKFDLSFSNQEAEREQRFAPGST